MIFSSELCPQICHKIHIVVLCFCISSWFDTPAQLKAGEISGFVFLFSLFPRKTLMQLEKLSNITTCFMHILACEILQVVHFWAWSQNKWQTELETHRIVMCNSSWSGCQVQASYLYCLVGSFDTADEIVPCMRFWWENRRMWEQ